MRSFVFMLLVCGSMNVFAQKTNFTGIYQVNEEKVNWGPAPKYILPKFIRVDQSKDKIIIARTPLNQQLQELTPVIDTIGFDGKAFVKKLANGGKISTEFKWADDKIFVLIRRSMNADGTVSNTTTEVWKIEDEGKTLFINRDVDGRMKYNTKAYFDKK